jgi:hypothetical protein
VPAAAVIPAPIAYIKVVAVKKLVVGTVSRTVGAPFMVFTDMLRYVLPVGLLPLFGRLFLFKGSVQRFSNILLSPIAVLFTECRGGPARLL